jgi:pimeloyl-ACP methyl ester carboxylesterase
MTAHFATTPVLRIAYERGGPADGVTLPSTTDGKEEYFTSGYRRHVLEGVGHFPTREASAAVNKLLIDFLKTK